MQRRAGQAGRREGSLGNRARFNKAIMAISTKGSARPADEGSVLWQFGQSLRLEQFSIIRKRLTENRPSLGLFAIVLGLIVNAAGNYGLMFGHFGLPRLELKGAAITIETLVPLTG